MSDIEWTNQRRKLSELIPWDRNPRLIKDKQSQRLSQSLEEFSQTELILIGPNNEIYDGHQRLAVWYHDYGDIEVDVRVSNRQLSEKEREKLVVYLHKGTTGEWDFDILANEFDQVELLEWGFSEWELGLGEIIGVDAGQLGENRQNNNLGITKMPKDNVGLNFGEIMTALPRELYERVLEFARSSAYTDVREGMISLFEAGLRKC